MNWKEKDMITMGRPDWTEQTSQCLPMPERLIIILISRTCRQKGKDKLDFSDIYESVKQKVDKNDLRAALRFLKDMNLIDCNDDFSEIGLTSRGRVSAANHGEIPPVSSPNINNTTNINQNISARDVINPTTAVNSQIRNSSQNCLKEGKAITIWDRILRILYSWPSGAVILFITIILAVLLLFGGWSIDSMTVGGVKISPFEASQVSSHFFDLFQAFFNF